MHRASRQALYNRCPGLLGLALALLLACGASAAEPGPPALFIFSDPGSASHRSIVEQIVSRFDGRRVGDQGLLVHALDDQSITETRLRPGDRTLVVTIGARAAGELSRHPPDVPVLNVFLPLATHQYLQTTAGLRAAAVVLDQPLVRQLALARALLPGARSAAMLQSEEALTKPPLQAPRAGALGFDLATTLVQEDAAPVEVIQEVLRSGDVVIATFDPHVYTPVMAKWLLYMALQQQRPIIGFSHALLEAGALASVFSTPEQIAEHAIELIENWLQQGQAPVGVAHPRYYHIGLNAPVARQLGVAPANKTEVERKVRQLLEDVR